MPELVIDQEHIIHYQLIPGKSNSPYLVFLHEGLGCIAMWKDFPSLLCDNTGYPGLIYDRLGYGQSSPLSKVRTNRYLHDYALTELPVLLEQVIPGRDFILVGHSDGGSISLIYAAAGSSRLKAVITEAAHVFVDRETITGIKTAELAWEKGKLKNLFKYHNDKTLAMFKAWSNTWLSSWFREWNIESLLPDIKVPVLAIQGENDHYGTMQQVDSIVSKTSAYAEKSIIKNCGHSPHLDAKNDVLKIMSIFISRRTDF